MESFEHLTNSLRITVLPSIIGSTRAQPLIPSPLFLRSSAAAAATGDRRPCGWHPRSSSSSATPPATAPPSPTRSAQRRGSRGPPSKTLASLCFFFSLPERTKIQRLTVADPSSLDAFFRESAPLELPLAKYGLDGEKASGELVNFSDFSGDPQVSVPFWPVIL